MARTERIYASATLNELTAATVAFSINSAINSLVAAAQRADRGVLWGTFEIEVERDVVENVLLGGSAIRTEHASVQVSALGLDASQLEEIEYEYETTTGPRKAWDGVDTPPQGEGWELDPDRGRPGRSWERFDYHEERYWRREVPCG